MGDSTVLFGIYLVALAVLGSICLLGTFHSAYDDTLLQRISMTVVAFGCVAEINAVSSGYSHPKAVTTVVCGVALFAVATVLKRLPRLHRHRS